MRNFALLTAFMVSSVLSGQNLMPVPDTLSGPVYNINVHADSVQFFPGQITQTYGINSSAYLGPTLILRKGTNISMVVNNQITDTTTMHWHGLHVAAMNDGGPHTEIYPGTSWNPQFTVLDHASTFWYHPHLHMHTAKHALKGAAGMIIVRDSAEDDLLLPRSYGTDDFPVIVQCQEFDSVNQINWHVMQDSILLVNGVLNAYRDFPAQVVRMRLLNASGQRTFNFGLTNNLPFYVIGNDGGLLSAPALTTRIMVSPGERAEILVDLSSLQGQTIHLMSYASELQQGVIGGPTLQGPPGNPPMDSPLDGINFNILQINVVAPTANPVSSIPVSLIPQSSWMASQANATRSITFTGTMGSMTGPFYFNGLSFDMDRSIIPSLSIILKYGNSQIIP